MTQRPLLMTINLNALEHLGMNLYSSIPAVLSEIVANSWDADANEVDITIDFEEKTITIQDDGTGMDRDGVIDRFLTVSYKKRSNPSNTKTPKGRSPMGRKGIGKLSIFAIAGLTEIYTISNGEKTAFRLDRQAIKDFVQDPNNNGNGYEPEEIAWSEELTDDFKSGTRIVLTNLSKSLSRLTENGLRQRVARRFSIIDPRHEFNVKINGIDITPEDRGYHKLLQYLWNYGDSDQFIDLCNLDRDNENRSSCISESLKDANLSLKGWIGTVKKSGNLKVEGGENLNRLAIFMRGKMAQEDILAGFGRKGIYADYIVGELHCEELDADDQDDIATSSRQAFKEDDQRYEDLRKIVLSELQYISNVWSEWRNSDGVKEANRIPAVSAWLEDLKGDTKKKAERWVGRLNTIKSGDRDKKELLKASVLAFESYRRKESLETLEKFEDLDLESILKIYSDIDDLEISYYGQIVKNRLEIVNHFKKLIEENRLEDVLKEYIFEHLWLIDHTWERVKGTKIIESNLRNFLNTNTDKLTQEEKRGRIDIGYRTITGKHVIVELKRPSVAPKIDSLTAQIRKYRDGARKLLSTCGKPYNEWPIEIICILGKGPPELESSQTGYSDVTNSLEAVDARIVYYNELITLAEESYKEFLEEHKQKDKLWSIYEAIDDFNPIDKTQ